MMSIYFCRSFPRSNSSFFLCSGNASKSSVLRLREEMFLVDAGPGTPIISMQDEPTGVPINRAPRFENQVGSMDVVAGESLIKEDRFFIDLVAGESLIKERAAARFPDWVGSTDVVAGEPLLLLPRRFRQNRAWVELNKIRRSKEGARKATDDTEQSGGLAGPLLTTAEAKPPCSVEHFLEAKPPCSVVEGGFALPPCSLADNEVSCGREVKGFFLEKVQGGYSVAIAGFITFLPSFRTRIAFDRFTIQSINPKRMNIVVF